MHFHPLIFDVLTDSVGGNEGVKNILFSCGFDTFQFFFFSHCVKHVAHESKGLQ